MLAEFSVVPLGKGESISQYVAECMKLVDASGLDYRFTPMGTVLEGDFDEVMSVIHECHKAVMASCPRVLTTIRIDDRKGVSHGLESKLESVEIKVGKRLKRE
ncbi:TPA: MTH1187 family thiamine-binding protein [Thermoplasmata archaeon]|nr:MTH1187 family thiamine-binding protein [Thermoplasmata archaeon]